MNYDAIIFQIINTLGVAFPDLGFRGAVGTMSYLVPYAILNGRQYLVAGGGNGKSNTRLKRAHLRLGGCGGKVRKQIIKATINPSQTQM
jgi:hypothetical protein